MPTRFHHLRKCAADIYRVHTVFGLSFFGTRIYGFGAAVAYRNDSPCPSAARAGLLPEPGGGLSGRDGFAGRSPSFRYPKFDFWYGVILGANHRCNLSVMRQIPAKMGISDFLYWNQLWFTIRNLFLVYLAFSLHSLCPYCFLTWLATIFLAWLSYAILVRQAASPARPLKGIRRALVGYWWLGALLTIAAIFALLFQVFGMQIFRL